VASSLAWPRCARRNWPAARPSSGLIGRIAIPGEWHRPRGVRFSGQMRTTLLALKLAEVSWMKERTGEWPVTLLDEVMAELDLQRRADLLHYVEGSEQVLLTATDASMFAADFLQEAEVWQVADGSVRR